MHEYSVKIHQYIRQRIAFAEKMKKEAHRQNDFETQRFYEGQLKELFNIRQYLTGKIDLNTQRYY